MSTRRTNWVKVKKVLESAVSASPATVVGATSVVNFRVFHIRAMQWQAGITNWAKTMGSMTYAYALDV